jgi:hypothetical protein
MTPARRLREAPEFFEPTSGSISPSAWLELNCAVRWRSVRVALQTTETERAVATIMLMHWREATPDQYDQAREKVGWDRNVPTGAKLHVSGFGDDGLHVTDVWESEQAFNTFMEQRLAPVVQEIGIQGQPDVKFFPVRGVFVPALGQNEQVSDL